MSLFVKQQSHRHRVLLYTFTTSCLHQRHLTYFFRSLIPKDYLRKLMNILYLLEHTGCQEIDVTLPFECKIIMSPGLVTLWCCPSMEAGQRLCFSERSLVPVCMCCCASSTGSFVHALIYQRLQCRYGEGVHLFDMVQGCGST